MRYRSSCIGQAANGPSMSSMAVSPTRSGCSKSVCALLMEGAGRLPGSRAEFRRYLTMALSSADETRLWCRYAQDLGYVEAETAAEWRNALGRIARMLHGLRSRGQHS
jgi:four helix bundle protein